MWTWLGSSRAGGRVVAVAIVLMALLDVVAYRLPVYANLFWPQDAREMRHISLVSVGIGLAQTLVLWLAYRRLAAFRARRLVVAALCVAIGISAAVSFAVPMQSHDAYAYVGYAKVTHFRQAYDPPQTPFTGTFAPISHDWGVPMVPCVYGPLWLALDRGIAGSAETLGDALVRLRFLNLVLVAAIAGILIALRVPEAWVWLFAVNPVTWNYLVFSAHNDVVAVFLASAAVLATTLGWLPLAVLLAAGAALSKVTFVLAALAPFALLPAVRARIACVASTVLIAAAGSWFFGGRPYLAAMFDVGDKYGAAPAQHAPVAVLHAALAALAVAAVCVALVRRYWIGSAIGARGVLYALVRPLGTTVRPVLTPLRCAVLDLAAARRRDHLLAVDPAVQPGDDRTGRDRARGLSALAAEWWTAAARAGRSARN
jgi:hypothetical protein